MQRRTLLRLGLGSALVLAAIGGGLALIQPGLDPAGRLTTSGREVFRAVARAVLDGLLPVDGAAAEAALTAHLGRLDETIGAFPSQTRAEISRLLSLLAAAPGRLAIAGLSTPWDEADAAQLQAALESMRYASLTLRQQAYHALRDLTNAAYFSAPATWPALRYPGPRDI